jgi:cytochrome c-type biogenesis protein CcmH/NrfG
MSEFANGILSIVWILNTAAAARGVSLALMESNGRAMSAQLSELTGQLIAIVEAQQAQDWLTVADILEYDFKPALRAWQPVFEGLRPAIPARS